MQKLMHWLSRVAMAAPEMPMSKTKMKRGSRAMLSTPPVAIPTIERTAFPSERRSLFITKEAHMMGAPKRM